MYWKFSFDNIMFILVICTILCSFAFASTNNNNLGYGEKCDSSKNALCDDTLICSPEGTCTCREPEISIWNSTDSLCYSHYYCNSRQRGTFYEPESGSCKCYVLKFGTPCHVNDSCPLNTKPTNNDLTPIRHLKICECIEGYFTSSDSKHCLKEKKVGDECDINLENQCSPKSFALCTNGTCACYEPDQWLDPTDGICKIKVGSTCDGDYRERFIRGQSPLEYIYGRCGRNSFCTSRSYNNPNSGKCECESGYVPTRYGTCRGKYGSSCQFIDDCQNAFDCVDGKCICEGTVSRIYDSDRIECRGFVGSSCKINDYDYRSCVPTSTCNFTLGLCTCQQGYQQIFGNNGKCYKLLGYGQTCAPEECDFRKGYACINAKCACVDPGLQFAGEESGCVAPHGFKCGNYGFAGECNDGSADCEIYRVSCESGKLCKEGNTFSEGKPKFICQ